MTVYITSYFNNIVEREINFYKNIKQFLSLGYNIVIYWMNGDFNIIDKKIKIIKGNKANASVARNVLLKEFYRTNDDYAIFSDDDTFLKKRVTTKYDFISLTNDYDKNIKETEKISSAFFLIKNLKKHYNLECFFDENLEANQDLDFGIHLNNLGVKTYRLSTNNIIIYKGKSSMFGSNMNKINKKQESLNYIIKKYGKHN